MLWFLSKKCLSFHLQCCPMNCHCLWKKNNDWKEKERKKASASSFFCSRKKIKKPLEKYNVGRNFARNKMKELEHLKDHKILKTLLTGVLSQPPETVKISSCNTEKNAFNRNVECPNKETFNSMCSSKSDPLEVFWSITFNNHLLRYNSVNHISGIY